MAIPAGADARRVATLVAGDLAAAGVALKTTVPGGRDDVDAGPPGRPYPRPTRSSPARPRPPPARTLLDQARATPDDPARTTLYHQAEAATLAALPATPSSPSTTPPSSPPAPGLLDLTPGAPSTWPPSASPPDRSTAQALCYNPPAPRCTHVGWRNRQTR